MITTSSLLYNIPQSNKHKHTLQLLNKIINNIMVAGKKATAEKILLSVKASLKKKYNITPETVILQAVENIRPILSITNKKVRNQSIKIPIALAVKQSEKLAIKWLIKSAKERQDEKNIHQRLLAEICDAYNKKGNAIKIQQNIHKLAEANRANLRFK